MVGRDAVALMVRDALISQWKYSLACTRHEHSNGYRRLSVIDIARQFGMYLLFHFSYLFFFVFSGGVFFEHGPVTVTPHPAGFCCADAHDPLQYNEFSWAKASNMLYVEQVSLFLNKASDLLALFSA
jgi:hypothetical protein